MLLPEGERQLRQFAAEVLAAATLELFPTAKLLGGGPTRRGFGYHFVFEQALPPEVLRCLEEKMGAIVRERRPVRRREMVRENAVELLRHRQQPLRAQRVRAEPPGVLDVIDIGEFWDVAQGPFPNHTGELGAFCLTLVEAEHDNGIFVGGLAFTTQRELKTQLKIQNAEKKYDHRRLGAELGLFLPAGVAGVGLWLWTPAGEIVRRELRRWWEEQVTNLGCHLVTTPVAYRKKFLSEAGGLPGPAIGETSADCKAVTLGHALLFGKAAHSQKHFSSGFAECARHFEAGDPEETGLRGATEQTRDIATFFCLEDQLASTLGSALHFILQALSMLGFEHRAHLLSYHAEVSGTRQEWAAGEQSLAKVAESLGLQLQRAYAPIGIKGPALWVNPVDSLGREFNGPAIWIEPRLPGRLDLKMQGADGQMHVPYMVAMTVFGSLERQMALLVEHFRGDLPVWLAPEQVRILPVTVDHQVLAESLRDALHSEGVRVAIDTRKETLGGRVRQAQLAKIPYTVVIGDQEREEGQLAVRRGGDHEIRRLAIGEWIVELKREIETRALGGRTTRL